MALCIIPARGGSKRIPRKNVRSFHGRPMIAWSIRAALESGAFDHVIVTTDDADISELAKAEGAEVPFLRPAHLSDDHTPTVPVVRDAIERAEVFWGPQDLICCLYATAPFVLPADLWATRILLEERREGFVSPVTSFPFPIQRGVRLTEDNRMEMFQPKHALTRSQDLEDAYHDVGQFYWGMRAAWFSDVPLIGPNTLAHVIPRHRVQDIDTPEDWDRAEQLFAIFNEG